MGQVLEAASIALLLAAFVAVQFHRIHLCLTPSMVDNVSGSSVLGAGTMSEGPRLLVFGSMTWALVSLMNRRQSTTA